MRKISLFSLISSKLMKNLGFFERAFAILLVPSELICIILLFSKKSKNILLFHWMLLKIMKRYSISKALKNICCSVVFSKGSKNITFFIIFKSTRNVFLKKKAWDRNKNLLKEEKQNKVEYLIYYYLAHKK